jgi:fermentation-respiration switch protein FrsA (DUF1100 family)
VATLNIEFAADDGVVLRGSFVHPDGPGPWPGVAMAQGAGAHKEWFLPLLAQRLSEVGIASLAFDNRSFGESDGIPRCEIDPSMQVRDYRAAISYMDARDDVSRIGAFGTSLSGGVVLGVGGLDHRLSCVVAQVPFLDGEETYRRRYSVEQAKELRRRHDADRQQRFLGRPPEYVVHANEDVENPGAGRSSNRVKFFQQLSDAERAVWQNSITLRSIELIGEFSVAASIPLISPTPVLFILVEAELPWAKTAYELAREPKKLIVLPGDHYDVYLGQKDEALQATVAWFSEWLDG